MATMQENRWRDCKSLSECMMHMLKNEIMCDVTLLLGENRVVVKAHKNILASRSEVFHTMFDGSLPEKDEIVIPDIDENTFKCILWFIYGDELPISARNVKEVYYAAEKYMLVKLKLECEKELKKLSKSDHATKALETAYQFHLSDLQRDSLSFIEKNTKKCLSSEHALTLSKECFELILQSDVLDCCETDVCHFFLKWLYAQCSKKGKTITGENLRDVAGSLLYLIRFPVVDMEFFTNEIADLELLTPDELLDIYKSHFRGNDNFSGNFQMHARCPISKRTVYKLNRCSTTVSTSAEFASEHSLTFQTNKCIWLKSISIFMPCHKQTFNLYNGDMIFRIFDNLMEEKVCVTRRFNYGFHTSATEKQITFPEPLQVIAETDYTIRMSLTLDGPSSGHLNGSECKEVLEDTASGITFLFKNAPDCSVATTVNYGQFRSFAFCTQ